MQNSISTNDLLKESWVLREKGSGTRETFDRVFKKDQNRIKIKLELEHTRASFYSHLPVYPAGKYYMLQTLYILGSCVK